MITSKGNSILPIYLFFSIEIMEINADLAFPLPIIHETLGFIPEFSTLNYQSLKSHTTNINLLESNRIGYKVTRSVISYHRM